MSDRTYEVRVTGLVPTQDLLAELGDVEIAEHELRTVLSGRFADQAALYGFLHRLRAFGLEVVEVRRIASPDEAEDAGPEEAGPEDAGPEDAGPEDAGPDDAGPDEEET